MEQFGELFTQARERRGLTLEDVAVKTRIHPDFLRALEESNFAKLPDQVFVKGFVRAYAQSLGLDEDDALRRFVEAAGPFYDKQSDLERLRRKQAEDERKRQANRKVLAAAVGVALLGLLLLLTREQSAVPPPSPDAPAESDSPGTIEGKAKPEGVADTEQDSSALPAPDLSPPSPLGGEPPGQTPPSLSREGDDRGAGASVPREAASSPATKPAPGRPAGPSLPGEALVLELEAHEMSWVVVQVDGESPQEALLRPGEKVQWKANAKLLVTLGNAGGVHVELNGVPQGPYGPSGTVVRDILFTR